LKKIILGLAAFAAILGAFSLNSGPATVEAASELRVNVACNPLTSSQSAQPGDSQLCRIRVRNTTTETITNITVDRPTPNTLTDRYQYVKYQKNGTPYNPVFGPLINCDLSGCDPFDLAPGETVLIFEESTFNPYLDGRGLTTATATGDQGSGSGTEQKSLP
jgi:hypothetical protein